MKRPIGTLAVGLFALAALVAVPAAMAAYTSPKLEVRQAGATTTFKLSQSSSEDATAGVRVFVPTGTTLTTTQAPGTVLGKGSALLKLHALAGAEVPVEANVVVAAPGDVTPSSQQACLQGASPLATWLLKVTIASVEVSVPVWLVPTSGALSAIGPAYVAACFSSPYLTEAQGGQAGQPQVVNVAFSIQGVFSPVAVGAFVAFLTPWVPGTGTVNAAGTVAAPAAVAPGAVTLAAKRSGAGASLTGSVTQAGQARGGASVTIFGGAKAAGLKRLGKAKVAMNGKFAFKTRTGTFFRADAVTTSAAAAPLCAQLSLPVPCVNPTVNGFTAKSKVVRKK